MPKYILTGVGGHLGSIAATYAIEIAPADSTLVFTVSDLTKLPPSKLEAWRSSGVQVTQASYDDVSSLERVFAGADAVNLISTWAFGRRHEQARNVIQAARTCGVRRICYTSFVGADDPAPVEQMPFLPRDHKQTEALIMGSGLEWNIQRDWLYVDNIPTYFAPSWGWCGERWEGKDGVASGAASWLCNSHGARGAYVAREDCGRVLAALLLGRGQPNTVYDVTGPQAVTDQEVFDWVCGAFGVKGELVDVPDHELRKWWIARGLPTSVTEPSPLPMKLCVDDLLCCGEMVARGYLTKTSDAVELLTGRKPLSFQEVLLTYKDTFVSQPHE
ncbi:NAD(P)-binding protein [Aspergillus saccharolyticus JOP 1030-1]|uniref:NAD(P)-binding protein n=1 Tax=Aspergillus saccharolyticus JOP 1030-1 TaxID=1450539 RepID=A0A318ZYA6_9EURO|nr:NAD(P)-binding protein [Aspergillus saccharolyticus JOP 1030-1]PYH49293.1 NAD(P)-binding protein [Aspergillus saccharolyticus JOP 1030-1]